MSEFFFASIIIKTVLAVIASHASYYLAKAYRRIYKSFLTKELDKINYKFDFKTDYINYIEEFCSTIIYIPIINVIYSIIKYNPFNKESVIKNLIEEGIVVEMTAKQIQKRDKKKLKKESLKTPIELEKEKPLKLKKEIKQENTLEPIKKEETELSKKKTKEQVKLNKELVYSDEALVLKIQTLLVKLKMINPKAYETFNMEYEELAKEGKLNNFMLKDFLARLLVSFDCDIRDASLLISYLDYLIVSYENKTPISNQIAELSFKELENIAKEIINNSNIYSREDKIVIYKKLSLLYLYLIYENKYINIDAIRNSCFNTDALLYGAILNIYELREQNIIEDNLLFDINEKYDLESVIKLIREMKFIRKENTYIKKPQYDVAI